MAKGPGKSSGQREEMDHASSGSASHVEQVHRSVCGAMERALLITHPAQRLDRHGMELAQSSPHGTGVAREGRGGQSLAGPTWGDLVAAYAGREAVPFATKDRTTSHDQQRHENLCRRSQP